MPELVRVTRGVWRPQVVAEDNLGRLAALLSSMPTGSVLAGATAAQLHGLWLPRPGTGAIEVIVRGVTPEPRDRSHSTRREVVARRQHLLPDEITMVEGLAVTTEARTWLDLAASLAPADLVALGDSALRGTASSAELSELIRRATHRPGVIRARAVLPWLDGRSRSRPESHLRYILVSGGLPAPKVNEPIHTRFGEWLAEPDLSYDDVCLALEYNGAVHADVDRMRRDITREVDISAHGWRSETFGPVQVFSRPDQVLSLVKQLRAERALLARRSPQ